MYEEPDAAPWPYTNTANWSGETIILRAGVSDLETLRRAEPDPDFLELNGPQAVAGEGAEEGASFQDLAATKRVD